MVEGFDCLGSRPSVTTEQTPSPAHSEALRAVRVRGLEWGRSTLPFPLKVATLTLSRSLCEVFSEMQPVEPRRAGQCGRQATWGRD